MNPIGRWVRAPIRPCVIALAAAALVLTLGRAAEAAPPLTDPEVQAWVAKLEGAWAGYDTWTPMGRVPFALLFERQLDGSLRARTAASRETWVELRFHHTPEGWRLTAGGDVAGLGEQWRTLTLERADGDTLVWADSKDPRSLRFRIAVETESLQWSVQLGGVDQARFRLPRVEKRAAVETLRRTLRAAQTRPEAELDSPEIGDDPSLDPRDARRQ